MYHNICKEHSDMLCRETKAISFSEVTQRGLCERNVQHFIFYHHFNFYMLSYHKCIEHGNKYDLYKKVIDGVVSQKSVLTNYSINRGLPLDKELRKQRLHGLIFKNRYSELNYTYSNNANKLFCFYTKSDKLECAENFNNLSKNRDNAKEYLSSIGLDNLHYQIDDLFHENAVLPPTEIEYTKSIDYSIKQINKLIKTTKK